MDDNQIINPEVEDDQLTHHGVKGMKWGVRRTPAQLGHKPATPRKKKPAAKSSTAKKKPASKEIKEKLKDVKGKIDAYRKTRAKNQAAKAAEKEKLEKEKFEAAKKKAVESGSAEEVLKYQGKLSTQELQTATSRLNMEAQLSQMSTKTKKTGLDRLEETANKIDRIRGATEKGISAWNTYAKIHNSLSPNDLPVLDGKYKDRAAARREREEAASEAARAKRMKKVIDSGSWFELGKHMHEMNADEIEKGKKTAMAADVIRKNYGEGQSAKARYEYETKKSQESQKSNSTASSKSIVSTNSSNDSKSNTSNFRRKGEDYEYDGPANIYDAPEEISAGRSYVSGLLVSAEDK